MQIKNDGLIFKISSITYVTLTVIHFILSHGYWSVVSWVFLIVTCLMVLIFNLPISQKNHLKFLYLFIAHFILYSLLILISFIDYPIPFYNTAQIVFTIGLNIFWLMSYLYLMYHKDQEDAMIVFLIVSLILIIFRFFSNSMRLISVVRGYLTVSLSNFYMVVLIMITVLMTLSFFISLFLYLDRVTKEINVEFPIKIKKHE